MMAGLPGMPPGIPQGLPSPDQGGGGGGDKLSMDHLGLPFIIGILAGAGLPILSRALRPGRTQGERVAQNEQGGSPAQLIAQIAQMMGQQGGGSEDMLPALQMLKMAPNFQGVGGGASGGMPPG